MTGESLYPRLEPLLAQVQKPIQYVGGELNSQVKDWDDAAVHWALMYPDAYEVGLPNQGLMILYEVLNERPDALAERTYAVWPDLAALMREHGVGAVHRRRAPGGARRSTCSASASPPSSATRTCSRRSTSPASRCTRPTATRATPSSSPAGTPRSTPSRSPTSSTAPCWATASRWSATSPTSSRAWKAQGRPGGRDELLARLARVERRLRAALLRRRLRRRRHHRRRRPHPGRRPGPGLQADRDGPRRVALPEDAAGADGRERARADERGDLPRLHPRLPVLPGRDDHPPGARADDHRHRLDGRRRACARPATRRSACCSLSSADHSEIGQMAKELADRYEGTNTGLSPAEHPGRRLQRRRWPTSCPATAGAAG